VADSRSGTGGPGDADDEERFGGDGSSGDLTRPGPGDRELLADAAAGPGTPPGAGVFSLDDRPAPGLYFAGWLLSGFGLAALAVALLSGSAGGLVLAVGGLVLLALGLSLAAGYQVLARAGRPSSAYRGPAPLLLFGVTYAVTNLLAFLLSLVSPVRLETPAGFLLGLALSAVVYVLVVFVFVVRTRALRWREMGWPAWGGRPASVLTLLEDVVFAAVLMVPVTFVVLVLGGLLGRVLEVTPPRQLPDVTSSAEAFLVALAAAIVAPVGEELFFRGFAMSAWWRDLGFRAAMTRSAAFFAFVHVINVQATSFGQGARQALLVLLVILPVGLVLSWLFARRGMLAAITGHVTYNGILLLLTALASRVVPPPA
jgi:membrane protease YdiL (CAAX protease family)